MTDSSFEKTTAIRTVSPAAIGAPSRDRWFNGSRLSAFKSLSAFLSLGNHLMRKACHRLNPQKPLKKLPISGTRNSVLRPLASSSATDGRIDSGEGSARPRVN